MAAKRKKVRLSSGEMELMSMLWQEGPLSLSAAHRAFEGYGSPIGYPTMQTRLNRLVEKGLATKSDERPARYKAAISPERAAAGHLEQLLDTITCTSVAPLVCQLISERPLTQTEIAELRELLAEAEKSAESTE